MLVIKTKVQIDRSIVLHFPSCVCILQNEYFFNYHVFEIGSFRWVVEFWVGGSVVGGRLVGG